jgi:hypothetical protein
MLALALRSPRNPQGEPVLALSKDEAQALAKAIANVQRHYESKVSAKTLDWIALMQCAGMIYGSRMITLGALRKAERQQQPAQPGTVVAWPATQNSPAH